MSYLNELLGENEAIVFASRQHWFILLYPLQNRWVRLRNSLP